MLTLNPWFAKVVVLMGIFVILVIRAPYRQRGRKIPVVRSAKGSLEIVLLAISWVAFFIPFTWIATPLFAFADYPLYLLPVAGGTLCVALGLWLFHRSHAELGRNWSMTLEMRENHQLVTRGLYRCVRHPMYLALFIYSAGQAVVVPNWLAGPSYAVMVLVVVAMRLGREEQMMLETFGKEYEAYAAKTKRLIPCVW